jgi:putative (di)nucleoside polyphosphate hydrolase
MPSNTNNSERVIDAQGFRPNVGIIICNHAGDVLWGCRVQGKDSWQFPQGGIHPGESPEEAMYRELDEEVGLQPGDVTIIGRTKQWLRYRLPARYIRKHEQPVCIGQKQKWFLLRLDADDDAVTLDAHTSPEFVDWRWVSYWYPINGVVDFKRAVYRQALVELHGALAPHASPSRGRRRRRKAGD